MERLLWPSVSSRTTSICRSLRAGPGSARCPARCAAGLRGRSRAAGSGGSAAAGWPRGRRRLPLLRPRTVVPVHYEGWSHFRDARVAAERTLAGAPAEVRDVFRWLPMGAATELSV